MRFKFADDNDYRVRSAFLVFPIRIGNELRWLESATWKERYDGDTWMPVAWVDTPQADQAGGEAE